MRTVRGLSCLPLLALASCGQTERAEDWATSPRATEQRAYVPKSPTEPSISLAGDWRIAGLNGTDSDQPVGIALKGDETKLWWEPRCAGMARGYAITGRTIRFTSLEPPRAPGEPTPPVCAIGLPPRLNEIFVALDAATSIRRTRANGIEIAGNGHSVTLFSQ